MENFREGQPMEERRENTGIEENKPGTGAKDSKGRKHRFISVREMVILSLLGAMTFCAKMVMVPLPNVEPVSLMVMLLAVTFGWKGFYAVMIYIGMEFVTWGLGLWSFCYLYVWLILFVLAILLQKMKSAFGWAALSGLFGLTFGALCAIVYWIAGGIGAAITWWLAGIPFDLVHGVMNFVIALLLFNPLRKLLARLKRQEVL